MTPGSIRNGGGLSQAAAAKLGLEIIVVPVKTAKGLPSALKSLDRKADSILGIADKTVYSSKTAKAVLLFSFVYQ